VEVTIHDMIPGNQTEVKPNKQGIGTRCPGPRGRHGENLTQLWEHKTWTIQQPRVRPMCLQSTGNQIWG